MSLYERLFPLGRAVPTEWAHRWGHATLQLPVRWGGERCEDPFEWRGLRFPNRVGIAAGFDKNAVVLSGIQRMGVGFVEVGTILGEPWKGNPKPRMSRLADERAIWNRLGFPSDGIDKILPRLAAFRQHASQQACGGMVLASNIAPHPRTVKTAAADFVGVARGELVELAQKLHAVTDLFVINLSSPNTLGLRDLLYGPGFRDEFVVPVITALKECDQAEGSGRSTPVLVKLPPEDAERKPWTEESLAPAVTPFCEPGACDGFVAVNTSMGLSVARGVSPDAALPGGLSGKPLLPLAESALRLLSSMRRSEQLLIGVGGVDQPEDAARLRAAGADLVEVYSGMIYGGPGFPSRCARAIAHG